jgi:hypothetical protein
MFQLLAVLCMSSTIDFQFISEDYGSTEHCNIAPILRPTFSQSLSQTLTFTIAIDSLLARFQLLHYSLTILELHIAFRN